ncbi:MAG: ABC transporter ATP-binding protein [Lachnospiraceae bacterium]|nr:ABC transporter ATP-binding protein [Lachnospiraceae bacterium]
MTLEVQGLSVSIHTRKGTTKPVNDVSLRIPKGKIIGIVGESGCGKSMTARACMGLLKPPVKIESGRILLAGRDLVGLPESDMCAVRGSEISMIFQEPMTGLNPVMKVGRQVDEAVRVHRHIPASKARQETIRMFEAVGIPEPEARYNSYPHELSGGLRQRVMIAMAMICRPALLIADEPTTALDVTVEAQILRLMKELNKAGTSILLISHNLGVIAQVCDYVYVMYAGQILEEAEVCALFDSPLHPYTRGLLESVNSLRREEPVLETIAGSVPDFLHLPQGCSFSPRCGQCLERCASGEPPLFEPEPGHKVRCHLYDKDTSRI